MWKNSLKILNPLIGLRSDVSEHTQPRVRTQGTQAGQKTCDVCATQTDSLRRGRCAPCYMRWSQHRPVGLGAQCVVCADRRCEFLQSVEFQQKWLPMCHNCSGRVARLDPVPKRLETVRELLRRDRREEERRFGAADPRLIPLNRRGKVRRSLIEERAVGRESNNNVTPPIHLMIDERNLVGDVVVLANSPVLLENGRLADTPPSRFTRSNDSSIQGLESDLDRLVHDPVDERQDVTVRMGVSYQSNKAASPNGKRYQQGTDEIGVDWADLLFNPEDDASSTDGSIETTSMTRIHRSKSKDQAFGALSSLSSDSHAAV